MKRQYAALAAVFAIAVTAQTTYTIDVLRSLAGSYPQKPFTAGAPWPTLDWVDGSGRAAGLRVGDRIVSLAGRVPRGSADLAQPLRERRTGDTLPVVVERGGIQYEHMVRLGRAQTATGTVIAVITWLFTPWLCLALGFWVTALRPRDGRAWLVLGMLLGLSLLVRTALLDPRGWPLAVGVSVTVYWEIAIRAWGASMMLFGIYFPQRWSVERRVPWVKWIFLVPLAATGLWDGLRSATHVVDYRMAARLFPASVPEWMQMVLLFVTAGFFFTGIASKYHDPALASDDRRRLRLLYWGCSVSMTPSFLMWVISAIVYHRAPSYGLVAAVSVAMLGLFPLTMAYVIVVQQAMDVRMVVRQGVQYALARRGILIIQALLVVGMIVLAATVLGESRVSRPQRLTVIALGTILALRIRDVGERLRRWVDRRFFREAYNAEQILSELGEQVRSILDRDALLETVTRRIA